VFVLTFPDIPGADEHIEIGRQRRNLGQPTTLKMQVGDGKKPHAKPGQPRASLIGATPPSLLC
jgi:hypothetical protein